MEKYFLELQSHIDLTQSKLAEDGLSLHVDNDLRNFKDFLSQQPETHGVPSTHDPDLIHLTPRNSFWVYVRDDTTKEIVSCHAQRLLITCDFMLNVMAQTYFANLVPSLKNDPLGLYDEAREVKISGRVLLGGGTYIHPDWRGKGLLIANRCSRTIAMRHFLGDYVVGTLINTPSRKGMALGGVAYAHTAPLIKGGLPGKPQADDVIIAWSSRWEWMQAVRHDLAQKDGKRRQPTCIPHRPDPLGVAEAAGNLV